MRKTLGPEAETIHHELARRILQGQLKTGERLPPQLVLATEFSVCRSTIQKAINRLAEEGRIESHRGGGTRVASVAPQAPRHSNTIAVMCVFKRTSFDLLQERALRAGHLLCVYAQDENDWRPERERVFLRQVKAAGHKALLAFCSPRAPLPDDLLAEIAAQGTRVIHLSPYRLALPDQEYLLPDFRKIGYLAGVSFVLRGYEQTFFAAFRSDGPYVKLMEQGFGEALAEQGQAFDPKRQFLESSEFWDGGEGPTEARLRKALETGPPVAVFCRGLEIAVDVRERLRRWGKRFESRARLCALAEQRPGPDVQTADVDLLVVDMPALIRRALDAALEATPAPLRELVGPRVRWQGVNRRPVSDA